MGMKTSIAWCDHTFNPWLGCAKVSPGCANCYAEGGAKRSGLVEWGQGKPRRRTSVAKWREPITWNRTMQCDCGSVPCDMSEDLDRMACPNCESLFRRPRVFCGSLMDWLDPEVPAEWLADLLALIHATPDLDWLLLTKKIGRAHV